MNPQQRLARQAWKEYSVGRRLAVTMCAGVVFVVVIPAFLLWLSTLGGAAWRFSTSVVLGVVYVVAVVVGLSLALWTVWVQFRRARGTPVPFLATQKLQKLLIDGPYRLCRNPMALGTILFYCGIAVYTSSWAAVLAVILLCVLLIAYIKLVEEKEMALRFGNEYLRYKQSVPFLIPCYCVGGDRCKK
jgi:protein-S-isoprenylcysteine O-methyltransferase Ste14